MAKDKDLDTFDAWFKELIILAKEYGILDLVDRSNPKSYLDNFDNGDSPEDVLE